MSLHIDIDNVIAVTANDETTCEAARQAAERIAIEAGDQVKTNGDRIFFHCEWEPPFKQLKKVSKEHPEATFTLWADAFQENHWIAKAIYQAGKGDEETYSRIDDDFPSVFKEIFARSEAEWEAQPLVAFSSWFPDR